jgi:hypothetical protein
MVQVLLGNCKYLLLPLLRTHPVKDVSDCQDPTQTMKLAMSVVLTPVCVLCQTAPYMGASGESRTHMVEPQETAMTGEPTNSGVAIVRT